MKCPSCGAPVPAGETICADCGTELVFAVLDDAPAAPAPTPVAPQSAPAAREILCPDCGESVASDDNGLCPVCGHDFGGVVEIDDDEFLREPLPLDAAMEAERQRLLQLQRDAGQLAGAGVDLSADPYSGPGLYDTGAGPTTPRGGESRPAAEPPLPGDRHRERYRSATDSTSATVGEQAWLEIEGGQAVFFDGRMTSKIRLDVDQVLIGRRDPTEGHYPDVDLGHFRHIDGHISRRHARIFRRQGRWFVEDLCRNDATYLNDTAHVLNGEAVSLSDGDRVLISDSVAMRFVMSGS